MMLLFVTDCLSRKSGAGNHLIDVIEAACDWGVSVSVATGRIDDTVQLQCPVHRVRALARPTPGTAQLARLQALLNTADRVHVQNVMNPTALQVLTDSGKSVVTVQDHRVFCPGIGRTLPNGLRCIQPMGPDVCAECLPDAAYRQRVLDLTHQRLVALRSAQSVIVLSNYMAAELKDVGVESQVIPPWIAPGSPAEVGTGVVVGGRLVFHKGIDLAWEAWRDSSTSQPLLVCGDGPLASTLTGASLQGWLRREALLKTLSGARMVLFPHRWQEPFGILGAEALAQGTPVIVMPSGGTQDWSQEGCVLAHSASEMSDAIAELSTNPDRALALGQAGQAWVSRMLSRPKIEAMMRTALLG